MTTESKDDLRAKLKEALRGTQDLKNQVKDQSTIIQVLTNRVRDLEKPTWMKTKYGNIPISFRPTVKVMELLKEQIKKSGKTMTKVIEECIEKVLGNGWVDQFARCGYSASWDGLPVS
jgi:hypothetical protein